MRLLDREGFRARYNFVYMPMDICARVGFGYIFVNLLTVVDAQECMSHFDGFEQWGIPTDEVGQAEWSSLQGLEHNVRRYRDSPVMHGSVPEEFKPVVLSSGRRLPFPEPTKPLRAPKARAAAGRRRSQELQ